MYFPWPPVEVALSLFNFSFCFEKQFFEKDVIKAKQTAISAETDMLVLKI
jgi:hypothetical protein